MEIEWAEPPEHVRLKAEGRSGKYTAFALGLQEQPGRWAKMPASAAGTEKTAKGVAQSIKRGSIKGFEKGMYDAIADGIVVYVRYKEEHERPKEGNGSDDDLPDPEHPHGWKPDDPSAPPVDPPERTGVDPKVLRQWAKDKGMVVPERGRLSNELAEAYAADMERRAAIRSV